MNQASNSVTHQSTVKKIPHVLMILDGFGHREDERDNAIAAAHTPNLDYLYQHYPHGLISGSGEDVGLPAGQFGNSEVGHMNLGAGRILYQDSTRIHKEIREQQFFSNPALTEAVQLANDRNSNVHIMGLLSDGGVHSHQDHIVAMVELALQQGAKQVFIHTFLDGRDTPPKSADNYVAQLQQALATLNEQYEGTAYLVSLIGRYFAMDRDKRWDRVQQAYDLLTQAKAERVVQSGAEAISAAYGAGESDEFVKPTWVRYANQNADFGTIQDNDSVIFMNFRADRAREISQALVSADFDGFTREKLPTLSKFVMLTKYSDELQNNGVTSIAFEPTSLTNTLGEYLQAQGKTQLRIAETEKYAHVTFFFSGGREAEFEGEQRILVNSPAVATYDLQPEMSAYEVKDKLIAELDKDIHDVVIVNFANCDMVGHTGVIPAAIKAVSVVDDCIGEVYEKVLELGGTMLITADHGNAEEELDADGNPFTAHTTNVVPLIVTNSHVGLKEGGKLGDLAPTMLQLLGLPIPEEMDGESLLK